MNGTFLVFGSRNHAKSGMLDNIKVKIPFKGCPDFAIEDSIKIPSGEANTPHAYITVTHRQWCTESKQWEIYCFAVSPSLGLLANI